MRSNLSGIYIFDTLEGEEKRTPTCIEDCREETRLRWLNSLEKEDLINTVERLCITLQTISKRYLITAK